MFWRYDDYYQQTVPRSDFTGVSFIWGGKTVGSSSSSEMLTEPFDFTVSFTNALGEAAYTSVSSWLRLGYSYEPHQGLEQYQSIAPYSYGNETSYYNYYGSPGTYHETGTLSLNLTDSESDLYWYAILTVDWLNELNSGWYWNGMYTTLNGDTLTVTIPQNSIDVTHVPGTQNPPKRQHRARRRFHRRSAQPLAARPGLDGTSSVSDSPNPTGEHRRPRLLLLLGQSPFDPTSGAAQSTRLIAEALAHEGFEVRALATTACEGCLPGSHDAPVAELDASIITTDSGQTVRFQHAGVHVTLFKVDPAWNHRWERHVGPAYNAEYQQLLAEWPPDFVLTYGGDPTDLVRRRQARRTGATVIFALHNLAYRKHTQSEVDAFLAPTRFLADAYPGKLAAPIDVLPVPLDPKRVLGGAPESSAVCFINPEPAMGSLLVAQLADRLGRLRPEITLLVVGGRMPAEALTVAGRDLGLDLTRFPNLVQIPLTGRVAEIWNATKVLLMPSVIKKAVGRCALEAMLNGIVPLVADHGGLPEMVRDAGLRLPPPPELTGRAKRVREKIVDAWWQALTACYDRPADYALRSSACREHASTHTLERVAPTYATWFQEHLARRRQVPAG